MITILYIHYIHVRQRVKFLKNALLIFHHFLSSTLTLVVFFVHFLLDFVRTKTKCQIFVLQNCRSCALYDICNNKTYTLRRVIRRRTAINKSLLVLYTYV